MHFSISIILNSADLEMAIAYWNIVLKDRFRFLDIWCQFLQVSLEILVGVVGVEEDIVYRVQCHIIIWGVYQDPYNYASRVAFPLFILIAQNFTMQTIIPELWYCQSSVHRLCNVRVGYMYIHVYVLYRALVTCTL